LLVSDPDHHLHAEARGARQLPARAFPYLEQLRDALARHAAGMDPAALPTAFAAAGGLVTTVAAVPPGARPDLAEMRRLAVAVPEFGAFLSCAADEAGRVISAGLARIWHDLGLGSWPPTWTAEEHQAARMLFACALAPAPEPNPARLQTGLRSLAAGRSARALAAELAVSEPAWTSGLGERYASVRHRCAPRTAWRSRGLSELLQTDPVTRDAVAARLEQWLIAGGERDRLAGELEAALVHARTPARFA
jgi:hypothetical protein